MKKTDKWKKWLAVCLCGVLLCSVLTACQQKTEKQLALSVEGVSEWQEPLADFSYELLRQAAREEQESILLSPLSAWLALSMTGQGAEDATKDAFVDFFQQMDLETQKQLASGLLRMEQQSPYLSIVNSIWCDDEITVNDSFLQTVQQSYQAEVMQEDLQGRDAVAHVNQWIAVSSKERISHMLEEIDDDTVMLLINCLTFDAPWQDGFAAGDTYREIFYGAEGDNQEKEFMHKEFAEAQYLSWNDGEGIILPYEGGDLVMVALLPSAHTNCNALVEQLSYQWIADLLDHSAVCKVNLALPKFTMERKWNLNQICQAMGLGIAFDPQQADFANLGSCNGTIYLGQALQNCWLAVDEAGTQAAAATVVEMKRESAVAAVGNIIYLELNRPFVYLIMDSSTQLPVFSGIYQGE